MVQPNSDENRDSRSDQPSDAPCLSEWNDSYAFRIANVLPPSTVLGAQHWSLEIAHQLIERHPNLEVYTCAAGISPSGVVHFGNFRDVMTSYMVASALRELGKEVRLIFSWDNYDRFRKVPGDIDSAFAVHIGKPLSAVPDPGEQFPSYAARYQAEFENSIKDIGIPLEY